MDMEIKDCKIPGLQNLTGEVLIYFVCGKPIRGFTLRKDQFVTTLQAIEEARRKAGIT